MKIYSRENKNEFKSKIESLIGKLVHYKGKNEGCSFKTGKILEIGDDTISVGYEQPQYGSAPYEIYPLNEILITGFSGRAT